jgi:hypothetical protein
MEKFHKGTLKSGGSGKKVTNPMQAVAIKYSEERNEEEHGGHYVSGSERKRPARKRGK